MNINGRWYTETEAQAYIITLEHKNAALEDKHLSECGQIAHYDDERKKIRAYLQHSAKTMTVHGVLEALALIGEDGETDDRINPFDDYTPNNCRWVNMMVQSHNKRARMDGE